MTSPLASMPADVMMEFAHLCAYGDAFGAHRLDLGISAPFGVGMSPDGGLLMFDAVIRPDDPARSFGVIARTDGGPDPFGVTVGRQDGYPASNRHWFMIPELLPEPAVLLEHLLAGVRRHRRLFQAVGFAAQARYPHMEVIEYRLMHRTGPAMLYPSDPRPPSYLYLPVLRTLFRARRAERMRLLRSKPAENTVWPGR
jgi:hypothetical protein